MEQNEWINKVLESSHRIEKVEAPSFLFTRIEQKIEDFDSNPVSIKWATAIAGAFAFLVVLNFILLNKVSYQKPENRVENEFAMSLGINYSNQLYSN